MKVLCVLSVERENIVHLAHNPMVSRVPSHSPTNNIYQCVFTRCCCTGFVTLEYTGTFKAPGLVTAIVVEPAENQPTQNVLAVLKKASLTIHGTDGKCKRVLYCICDRFQCKQIISSRKKKTTQFGMEMIAEGHRSPLGTFIKATN